MNTKQYIITIMLLLTVSCIIVGCASKLTEEQALAESQLKEEQAIAESQALLDGIKNRFSGSPGFLKIELPVTRRVGKTNQRLVLLSPRGSLRWLREAGFKININSHAETMSRRKGNMYSRSYRSPGRTFIKVDDPQYIYFNNSRVMITGVRYIRDPQDREEILWIYDQFSNPRVVTYEQY
ncbi:hypothetical protein F4225_15165 [Candidatus Poribacteria bacterium]|nr:hypothetical protein [Candidatus Poribacteria bacterium]